MAIACFLLLAGCGPNEDSGPEQGAWRLAGVDANGVNWTATFTVATTDPGYSGTFAWRRNGADAGTESFIGTYDQTNRRITLTGEQARGNVVRATYVATLSPDRSHMTDGRWTSSEGPAGTWQAERAPN